ncbi:MAG: hypothetical protein IKF60_01575, partial [Solobacterium sp.]|nr:hypothetical protein [Solobacterium sp.]
LSDEIVKLKAANNSCNSETITAGETKKAISEENNDAAQQTLNAAPATAPETTEEAEEESTEETAEIAEAAELPETEVQPQEEPVTENEPVEDQEVTTETAFHLSDSDATNLIMLMEEKEKSAEELKLEQAIQGFAAAVANKTQHKTTSKVLDESINSLMLLQGGVNRLNEGMAGTESTAGLVAGAETLAAGANDLKNGILVLEGYADETGKVTVDKNGNPLGGLAALKTGADQLSNGSRSAAAGAGALATGVHSISDGAAALADGTSALSAGSKELSEGTGKLAEGAGQLKDGTSELDNGVSTLRDGVIKLNDGSAALDDGALELLEGMETFESEGMDKLAEVFGDKLGDIIDRLSALNDAGTSYNNFSGASGNENDSVKFIFKTESVKAE